MYTSWGSEVPLGFMVSESSVRKRVWIGNDVSNRPSRLTDVDLPARRCQGKKGRGDGVRRNGNHSYEAVGHLEPLGEDGGH